MASLTLRNVAATFPVGTTVGAYAPSGVLVQPEYLVRGSQLASGVVQPDGSLPFTGLSYDTTYVASDGSGTWRFSTGPEPVVAGGGDTSALDSRITALELALPSKVGGREEISGGGAEDLWGSTVDAVWTDKTILCVKRGRLTVASTRMVPSGYFPGALLMVLARQPAAGGCTIAIDNLAGPQAQWLSTAAGALSLGLFISDGSAFWPLNSPGLTQSSSALTLASGAYTFNVGS